MRNRLSATGLGPPVPESRGAPRMIAAPVLSGAGKIGQPVSLDAGLWVGDPLPTLVVQWRRDGVDIPGATGPSYTPGPEDDRTELTASVRATSPAGAAEAVTAGMKITYVAPEATGALYEEVFDEGTGSQLVPTADAFTGEGLRFAVTGAEAAIDAATGVVAIPTDAPVSGEAVTVTAMNSGGEARAAFLVTVEAGEYEAEAPEPPARAQMTVTTAWDPDRAAGTFRIDVAFEDLPEDRVIEAVEWTALASTHACLGPEGFEKCVPEGGIWRASVYDSAGPARHLRAEAPGHWRYRWKVGGVWSAPSENVADLVVRPISPPADPGEPLWRPMPRRVKEQFGADKVDFPQYYTRGMYGGEGYQWAHGSARGVSHPDRIVWAQDMGTVRASTDGGKSWFTPPNLDLELYAANSVAIDSSDGDIVFVAMSAAAAGSRDTAQSKALDALEGIYRSTDFCRTWELVQKVPQIPNYQRYNQQNFACWPPSGGEAAAREWRFATMYQDLRDTPETGSLWASNAGGTAWTKKGDLPYELYGAIGALVQHPDAKDTLYLVTSTGLWRTTDFGAQSPSFTRPWTTFGADVAVSALWIDPGDANRMIVSVRHPDAQAGVWFTTDGGTTWTQALDGFDAGPIGVGAARSTGERTVYVHSCKDSTTPQVGIWTGTGFSGSWSAPSAVPSASGRDDSSFTRLSGKSSGNYSAFCFFLPHPTDPDRCVSYGYHHFWRTEDAGRTFVASNTGFVGQAYRVAYFDPSNWECIDFGAADAGRVWTRNGGDYYKTSNVTGSRNARGTQWYRMEQVGKVGYRSVVDITRLPNHPALPAEARGRCIMTLGGLSSHFIFTQDEGSDAWADFIELPVAQGGGSTSRNFVDYDRQAPNHVYAGPNVSSDGGTSWGRTASGLKICAMSHQDGRVVYARADTNIIVKSTDRGASWIATPFYGLNRKQRILQMDGQRMRFWLCPHDDTRAYSVGANDDLVMIQGTPGTTKITQIPVRGEMRFDPTYFSISDFGVDGNDPHLIYVCVNAGGNDNLWRGTWNDAFTRLTWESITRNAPRLMDSSKLAVHPTTGEVLVMNHNGCFVLPPPEGYREKFDVTGSLWERQPKPIPNGWNGL